MGPELVGKVLGLPGVTVGDPGVKTPPLVEAPMVGAVLALPGITVGMAVVGAGMGPELVGKAVGLPGETVGDPGVETPPPLEAPLVGAILGLPGVAV